MTRRARHPMDKPHPRPLQMIKMFRKAGKKIRRVGWWGWTRRLEGNAGFESQAFAQGWTYTSEATHKNQNYLSIIQKWPCVIVFTIELQKNTKENMPSDHFCSHFLQDGQFVLLFQWTPILKWFEAYMAIWHQRWQIWVLPEKAIKIKHSGEGINSIRPSY